MPACTSPSSAKRAGMVVMSKSCGWATPTSSQVSGAETGACGRGRTEYAEAMVRSRAVWL